VVDQLTPDGNLNEAVIATAEADDDDAAATDRRDVTA
jgi:hypothetical protein